MMSNDYNNYLFRDDFRITTYQRPILERNSTGKYVKELQMSLNELNYLAGNPDGIFGHMTETAVKNFQTDYKLPVTGIVDEVVWNTIDTALIEEPVSNFPTIKKGDNNIYVKSLQLKLMNLGFFTGIPDGIFGDDTLKSVKNFQQANNLSVDGIVGPLTWRQINRSFSATELPIPTLRPTIKEGDTGENVRLLQEILSALNLYNEEISSVFGNDTKNAVIRFQELNELEQTGVVDTMTWEALSKAILSPRSSDDELRKIDYTVLKEGDTDESVIILQDKLKITGDYAASVTGSFGPETTEAVKSFQTKSGLPTTGVVDDDTWTKLFEATALLIGPVVDRPTLRVGSTGDYVRELQQQLTTLMFYNGPIDGVFGTMTETAVKAFQTNNKLTADGIVGRVTWSALIYLYSPLAICNGDIPQGIKGIVVDAGHGQYC